MLNRRATAALAIAAVLCVAFLSAVPAGIYKYANSSSVAKEKTTVIIDAGHGGFDGGAVARDGTVEKDINLKIALTLCDMLKYNGYDVIMSRTTDTGTEDNTSAAIQKRKVSDLKNRLSLMEKYPQSVFVSVHLNKFTASSAIGAQVFYSKNNSNSMVLGNCIQQSFKTHISPDNERVIKPGTKNTYLLYNAKIPAVIVECGFISNSRELELLKTQEYQKQLAFSIYCGINDYFNTVN